MENNFYNSTEVLIEISNIAKTKTSRKFWKTLLLGILAGAYISLGCHLFTTATTGETNIIGFGLTKVIGGIVFSLGLILVVLTGTELFTGNTMVLSVGLLAKQIKFKDLIKNWLLVWIANFLGAILIALLIYHSGLDGNSKMISEIGSTAVIIAKSKTALSFTQVFIRGILANWLVCLAIFIATMSKDFLGKIVACLIPIMAFVAMGFEHSIANMFFLPIGFLLDPNNITLVNIARNLSAATLGNIIGGSIMVALIYWISLNNKSTKN